MPDTAYLVDELERLNRTYGELWERIDDIDIWADPERAARLERAFRRVERDRSDLRARLRGQPVPSTIHH